MGDLIVSIDIGTSNVCTLIGRVNNYTQLDIVGRGITPCNGLKKGVIVDIDSTAASIRDSIEKAELTANMRVGSAYVNIHGMHVNVINNTSQLNIDGNEITRHDIENILHEVSSIEIPEDRQLIDVIPRQYIIDGYDEIIEPAGMVGTKFEVDADILTGKITSVQNIIKSMERAGVQIDGIVAEAFATGEIGLTQDERDIGVVLLDVGGSVTDVSVFHAKRLVFYDTIPVGGDHITNDIAIGLRITNVEAEKIKRQFELALTSLIKNDQEISVMDINENKKKDVKVSEVVEIIEARVYEIFSLCKNMLDKAGVVVPDNGSVVMTGAGISYVDGCKQLANEVFELPVRTVQAGQIQGVSKPEYIAAAGMIKYVSNVKKGASHATEIKLKKPATKKKEVAFFSKLVQFFKDIF
ncbi:MAG: cell division protein FtsA [Clostridiaceae bacterium]|nr:cell division protein FtsA [Clostridiaceae bacterium]